MVRRSLLSLVDQGLWALTNFVAVALAARGLDTYSFGVFSLCFSVMVVVSGLSVALSGEALGVTRGLLIRTDASPVAIAKATARSTAIVACLALAGTVLTAVALLAFSRDAPGPSVLWLVLGCCPFLILGENLRAIHYALRRIRAAVSCTLAWIVGQGITLLTFSLTSGFSGAAALASWGIGALSCSVVGVVTLRIRPALGGSDRREWGRRCTYAAEYLATAAPPQLLALLAAGPLGLAAAGNIRALQTLYGPLNTVLLGLRNAVVPAVSEDYTRRRMLRASLLVALLAGGVTVLLTMALALLPDLGRLFMGRNWPTDPALVLGYGLTRLAASAVFGAMIIYRTSDLYRTSFVLRIISGVALLLPFIFLLGSSLTLALFAAAGASCLVAALWWLLGLVQRTDRLPRRSVARPDSQ